MMMTNEYRYDYESKIHGIIIPIFIGFSFQTT